MYIAQISDCHITVSGKAYGKAATNKALHNAVAHLNTLPTKPDCTIITGDIVDAGKREEYVLAKELLSELEMPFYIVPGNHDHRATMRSVFSEHDYLQREDSDASVRYSIEEFPVRLIGLDSVRPGLHGGGIDDEDLQWLEQKLTDEQPTIVFMHHAPFATGVSYMDKEGFFNTTQLKSILNAAPDVLRVCCGHIHRPIMHLFGNTPACVCPSTGLQLPLDLTRGAPECFVMEPNGFALHSFSTSIGGEDNLTTYFGVIPESECGYDGPYPFYDVVSPA